MSIRAASDHVIICQDAAVTEAETGILLPTIAQERPATGVVVSVGPGRVENGRRVTKYVQEIRVGDRVYYHKVAAMPLDADGEKFVVIEAPNVLGVLE